MQDFEVIVLIVILFNCVMMALYQPLLADDVGMNRITGFFEVVCNLIFTVEILLTIAAAGSLYQYFSNAWNTFDFILVAVGYTTLLPISSSASGLKVSSTVMQS